MPGDFDRRYDDLLDALMESVTLPCRYDQGGWADWLDLARRRIQRSDEYRTGPRSAGFGGMGSLNDLVIYLGSGDPIAEEDIDPVKRRLDELRGRIYPAATAIRHDLDRETSRDNEEST